jgi:hypothetical protein
VPLAACATVRLILVLVWAATDADWCVHATQSGRLPAGELSGRLARASEPYEVLPDAAHMLLDRAAARTTARGQVLEADPECTFTPQIHPVSRARAPRGVDSMCYHDTAAKQHWLEEAKWRKERAQATAHPFKPNLMDPIEPMVAQVQSCVRSPGFLQSYHARLEQLERRHWQLEEARQVIYYSSRNANDRLSMLEDHMIQQPNMHQPSPCHRHAIACHRSAKDLYVRANLCRSLGSNDCLPCIAHCSCTDERGDVRSERS